MSARRADPEAVTERSGNGTQLLQTAGGGLTTSGLPEPHDTLDDPLPAAVDRFERLRPRLFGIAYRMLGSVEDAEDVVQEAYLRWEGTDPDAIRSAEAWLVTVTTRLAINRLRRAATEREHYAGHWLPEPIATAPEPADRRAETRSDLSLAFLVLLERLSPEERAAFLLRDVFDTGYAEIARVLERTEAACRQLVHRARARVRTERARFRVPVETHERLLERFLAALGRRRPGGDARAGRGGRHLDLGRWWQGGRDAPPGPRGRVGSCAWCWDTTERVAGWCGTRSPGSTASRRSRHARGIDSCSSRPRRPTAAADRVLPRAQPRQAAPRRRRLQAAPAQRRGRSLSTAPLASSVTR